jgi:hypothetical protein
MPTSPASSARSPPTRRSTCPNCRSASSSSAAATSPSSSPASSTPPASRSPRSSAAPHPARLRRGRPHLPRPRWRSSGIRIRREAEVAPSSRRTRARHPTSARPRRLHRADLVMYATGRAPNTVRHRPGEGGRAAQQGRRRRGRRMVVDRSSVENIFAVGDCTDRVNLTPVAIAEGRASPRPTSTTTRGRMDYANIPSAVFSQPPRWSMSG